MQRMTFRSAAWPKVAVAALMLAAIITASPASAQQCGGDFHAWLAGVKREAVASGVSNRALRVLSQVSRDARVISRDRAQGVFAQTFRQFSDRMVAQYRLTQGAKNLKKYARIFTAVERHYGVPGPVITAFWGLETDFGANQGDFSTLNALATLAHDCRRPALFRPQLIHALKIIDRGDLTPGQMVGAWAGELGQTQLLPSDYLGSGVDFDGNGRVDLRGSVPDVLATTGNFIASLGWRAGEPWLQEVSVPARLPWDQADLAIQHPRAQWAKWGVKARSGRALKADRLPASLILPMGRKGPAFLVYPNFRVYLEWNKSLVYSTTAAYFATRLAGAPKVSHGNPAAGLSLAQTKQLQKLLAARGYDVGKIDGIIGAGTRAAVKAVQLQLGLPADSWPTPDILARLR